MPDYPCPWPSKAARERAHIRAIWACVQEYQGLPGPALLRKLAEVHLEYGRPDMADERSRETHDAPRGGVEAPPRPREG